MLNFHIPEKDPGLVSPPHFVYDFSRKMFLMLHSITDRDLLSDCFYFSGYCPICVLQLLINQTETS